MKPHELCKHHGIKGVTELARITGRSPRTLHAWANKSPEFFEMVVLGAAQVKTTKAERHMDTRTIQQVADAFNIKYHQAYESSKPEDWLDAALVARQMVNIMHERGLIDDSLPELQSSQGK